MRIRKTKGVWAVLALCPALALAQDQEADPTEQPAADLEAQYAELLRRNEALRIYNDLLTRQIAAQEVDLTNIQASIEQVPELVLRLPPLLITMIEGLEEFIRADIPFLLEERRDRVADLWDIMEETAASDVEKLRRILGAWMIEIEYGGSGAFQVYSDEATLPDGTTRQANFVQLGRIGLIYQTTDEDAITGAYDYRDGSWVQLGSEHRNSVRQAIRMGASQIAPELVLLPVVPPQPAQ